MITIIAVGKLKEKYWRDAVDEYQKRISRFDRINIIEIDDQSNNTSKEIILQKEAQDILERVNRKSYIISLAIEGKELSSVEFSKMIDDIHINGQNAVTFITGGSVGLDEKIKDLSNQMISFGRITLPHQLARVVLVEQIYRANTILNHITYHK